MIHQPDPYAEQAEKQKKLMIWGAAGAVVLLLLGIGIGVLAARKEPDPSVLVKPQKPAPPVLAAKADPGPPVLPADNAMPKDVLDWLEHLRKTEQKRNALTTGFSSQVPQLMASAMKGGLTDRQYVNGDVESASFEPIAKQLDALADQQATVKAFLDSKVVPAECAAINSEYQQTLVESERYVRALAASFRSVFTDPGKSTATVTDATENEERLIDESTRRADSLIQAVCDKYKTRKWFSLEADVLGGLGSMVKQLRGGLPNLGGLNTGAGTLDSGLDK